MIRNEGYNNLKIGQTKRDKYHISDMKNSSFDKIRHGSGKGRNYFRTLKRQIGNEKANYRRCISWGSLQEQN